MHPHIGSCFSSENTIRQRASQILSAATRAILQGQTREAEKYPYYLPDLGKRKTADSIAVSKTLSDGSGILKNLNKSITRTIAICFLASLAIPALLCSTRCTAILEKSTSAFCCVTGNFCSNTLAIGENR